MEMYSYISVLATDDYLDGILVLNHSLKQVKSKYPFLVIVTSNISKSTLDLLSRNGIQYEIVEFLKNPTFVQDSAKANRGAPDVVPQWYFTYSKLHIFGLEKFDKLVYLDADMLVYMNIDELFNKPHMSAVNAGGMLPKLQSWTSFNSGLMVIEPSLNLYNDMMNKVGNLENFNFGGDQDFLQAYYPTWPENKELHLDHRYNIFCDHLNQYISLFNYTLDDRINEKSIKVVHYTGKLKPWHQKEKLSKLNNRILLNIDLRYLSKNIKLLVENIIYLFLRKDEKLEYINRLYYVNKALKQSIYPNYINKALKQWMDYYWDLNDQPSRNRV